MIISGYRDEEVNQQIRYVIDEIIVCGLKHNNYGIEAVLEIDLFL